MGENFEKGPGRGGSWAGIGCGVMIILVCVTLLLPGRRSAGPAAKGVQTVSNLKNVGLAGMNFESQRGEFLLKRGMSMGWW